MYTRRRKVKTWSAIQYVLDTQANTNNVNKTWAILQTTRGKDEPNMLCGCVSFPSAYYNMAIWIWQRNCLAWQETSPSHFNQYTCIYIERFYVMWTFSIVSILEMGVCLYYRYNNIWRYALGNGVHTNPSNKSLEREKFKKCMDSLSKHTCYWVLIVLFSRILAETNPRENWFYLYRTISYSNVTSLISFQVKHIIILY